MPLIDAVHAIEAVGGILLGMSGLAFIFLGVFAEIRKKSAAATLERRVGRKLDLVKTENRPASTNTPEALEVSPANFVSTEREPQQSASRRGAPRQMAATPRLSERRRESLRYTHRELRHQSSKLCRSMA
jgi:hypothetical protein